MIIREEKATDYESVCLLVKEAFKNAQHSDGNEHKLVNSLRDGKNFIPKLSLVAEMDNKIVGYILFTEARVKNNSVLALAPLAVHPQYQRIGIGSALINRGHEIARELGFEYSIVLGSDDYYPKFGYVPSHTYNIYSPFDVPKNNYMANKLNDNAVNICGIVEYAEEFGIR